MPTFEQLDKLPLHPVEKALAQMLLITAEYIRDTGYDPQPCVEALDTLLGAWA